MRCYMLDVPMNKTILIVDDYAESLLIYRELFEMQGYEVSTVESVEQATSSMISTWPSLVIVDDHPMGISGVRLVSQLKRLATEYARAVPVAIALRGDVFGGQEPVLVGFEYVFGKPLDFERLDAVVHHILRGPKTSSTSPVSEAGIPRWRAF